MITGNGKTNRTLRDALSYFEGRSLNSYCALTEPLGLVPSFSEFIFKFLEYLILEGSKFQSFFESFKNETKTNWTTELIDKKKANPDVNIKAVAMTDPVLAFFYRVNAQKYLSEEAPVFRFVFLLFFLFHWRSQAIDKYTMLNPLIRFLPTLNAENATRFIVYLFRTHTQEELGSNWITKLETLLEIGKEEQLLSIAYAIHSICTEKEKEIENLSAYLVGTIRKSLDETRFQAIPEADRMAINEDIGALWIPTFDKWVKKCRACFDKNDFALINSVISSVVSISKKKLHRIYIGKAEGIKIAGGAFLRDFMQWFEKQLWKIKTENEVKK